MINLLVLLAWALAGVTIAAALADPDEPRWAWAPLAAVLGPLWASVALDQRAIARTVPVPAYPPRDQHESGNLA